ALAHITGGGIPGNLPRVLPPGCGARIEASSWSWPPLFELLRRLGQVPLADMRRTFNLGIGMIAVLRPARVPAFLAYLRRRGEAPVRLGCIVAGARRVSWAFDARANAKPFASAAPAWGQGAPSRREHKRNARRSRAGARADQ
ncbi:MAG: AIR synthase-related protein, partial [Terriglobales bacterium]